MATNRNVRFDINPGADGKNFKYLIYDGYRPKNLAQMRQYVDFILQENVKDAKNAPPHVLDYMK